MHGHDGNATGVYTNDTWHNGTWVGGDWANADYKTALSVNGSWADGGWANDHFYSGRWRYEQADDGTLDGIRVRHPQVVCKFHREIDRQ